MTRPALKSFPADRVRLLPSGYTRRSQLNHDYIMGLDSRGLLQNFYWEAGLNQAPEVEAQHGGWEHPSCQVRGHFLGHWLSAASRIVAATGDAQVKGKADRVVAELGRCQKENGGEWVGSTPEKYLHWIAAGKGVWAPQYVHHKTLMGLLHMHVYAGSEQALDIAVNWSRWFHRWTDAFSREQMDDVLDVETGGMLEAWADLYGITGRGEHLDLVRRYDRPRLFEPLLAGEDPLTNRHANTTIPEAHGAARAWEVTGEPRWRDVAEAYWQCAVVNRGLFCTGGQTCGEVWTPPFEFAARLGSKNQEHCTVFNMMRLAEYLLRWNGDAAYADYWERNLVNGILAQQHPGTGMVAYFLPLAAGRTKVDGRGWGTRTQSFWCCHGTLVQAHTMHNSAIFYECDGGVAVCQFIPGELTWPRPDGDVLIALTQDLQTDLPRRPDASVYVLEVTCATAQTFALRLRVPWWCAGEARITINGEPQAVHGGPSSFAVLERSWRKDSVRVEFPGRLTACPLPDQPDTVAFMDGPVVLAGLYGEERTLLGDRDRPETFLVADNEREWGRWQPTWRTRNQPVNFRFVPLHEVADETYTVYFPCRAADRESCRPPD